MLEIGKSFCLVGEHEKRKKPMAGKKAIILKPFTSDYVYREDRGHFLDLLEDLNLQGKRVMDVGTGAGFVAIAAARLGALVVAVDPDKPTIELVKQNVKLNGLQDKIVIVPHIFDTYPKVFDIIASNITVLDTYLEILPELEPRLADGGVILLQVGGDLNITRIAQGGFPIGMKTLVEAVGKSPLEIYDSVVRGAYEYWYLRRKNG